MSIDTGRGGSGTIKITDTSKTTSVDSKTYYLSTKYERIYDTEKQAYSIKVKTWYTNQSEPSAYTTVDGSSTTYTPTSGYRYVYVTGQVAVNRETFIYGTSSWAGIDWLAKDPGSLRYYQRITIGDPVPLDNGEYLEYQARRYCHTIYVLVPVCVVEHQDPCLQGQLDDPGRLPQPEKDLLDEIDL